MDTDDGFCRQTAKLLRRLGAGDLVNEVKKRNLSTDVLYKLTKEDFIRLGAPEDQAEYLVSNLSDTSQTTHSTLHAKSSNFTEILKQGQEQLSLLHAFLAHCRVKLEKKPINFIVDADKNIHVSNLFCVATEAICSQMQSIEQAMTELQQSTTTMKAPKDECKSISTCRRLYLVVSGISAALCTVLYMVKNKPNFPMYMKH